MWPIYVNSFVLHNMELSVLKLESKIYEWPHFMIIVGEDNNDKVLQSYAN